MLSIDHTFLSISKWLDVFDSCLIILISFEFVFVTVMVLDLRVYLCCIFQTYFTYMYIYIVFILEREKFVMHCHLEGFFNQ